MIRIRRARPDDLPALEQMELRCFDPARRDSPRVLRRSLTHPTHEIWLLGEGGSLRGALFLRFPRGSMRIHSVAVLPEAQGRGFGSRLMKQALNRAEVEGARAITLEAPAGDEALVAWYEGFGFRPKALLPDYYGPGRHGRRLRRPVKT